MKQVFDVPERGDVVGVAFSPRDGSGQPSPRHAVVLSPQAYNARVGLAVLCPIVSLVEGYPFEVPIPPGLPVTGVILADQAVSMDWRAHRTERICSLPPGVVDEALGKLRTLLGQ
jgi:mRNA interferase MazF